MGADGGLEFLRLKKPEKHQRLRELVGPLRIEYYSKESAASRISKEGCWNYLKEHTLYEWNDEWFIGMYGTDLPDLNDIEDLFSMMDDIQEEGLLRQWLVYGINPEINTFMELFEEQRTRPDFYGWSPVDQLLEKILRNETEETFKKSEMANMTLNAWVCEINSIIDRKSYFTIETWT